VSEREGLLLAAARAGSLAEIAEIRPAIDALLEQGTDDADLVAARDRLDALRDALEAIGLVELPPSTGAR
jgi:hypothetical protein